LIPRTAERIEPFDFICQGLLAWINIAILDNLAPDVGMERVHQKRVGDLFNPGRLEVRLEAIDIR
jgi:hypothetical protein